MTRAFVADASVAIGWVHPAQATKHTAAMLDAIADGATLDVPALWSLEVANALVILVRRRKLTEHEAQEGLGWLGGLRVRVDHEMSALASRDCPSWPSSISCRFTTPRTWSWRSAADSCWVARMAPWY